MNSELREAAPPPACTPSTLWSAGGQFQLVMQPGERSSLGSVATALLLEVLAALAADAGLQEAVAAVHALERGQLLRDEQVLVRQVRLQM